MADAEYGPPCQWGGKDGLPLPAAYAVIHRNGNREYWEMHGNVFAMKPEDPIMYFRPTHPRKHT